MELHSEIYDFKLRSMMKAIEDEELKVENVLGVSTINDFNEAIRTGRTREIINVSEALQEKNISSVAGEISRQQSRVVLIAGPSSSGKTTFSRRLSLQLMAHGLRPYSISLDDYYLDKDLCPKDENGDYDFESIYALNIEKLNNQLRDLFRGEEVELPRYDFMQGMNIAETGVRLRLKPDMVLILEGIHALNPMLTSLIPDNQKFRVYVAPLTSIKGIDGHPFDTICKRLLRRIIRDYKYRNMTAQQTIHRWKSVRAGEEKWIQPFQGYADVMINTSLIYELQAIKAQAVQALSEVPEGCEEKGMADTLLNMLEGIDPMTDMEIPPTSLLREFLGGSAFEE